MGILKQLNASEIFAQIISFLILFFILRAFAWKRLLKLLDERKARIAENFKKIEAAQDEVARIKNDYQGKLDAIDQLAQARIREAISEGRKITDEVRKSAHLEAQEIIENARQNIRHELTKAKEELKDKVIDLTIKVAEDIIREKLTGGQDRKLVREFLDKVDEA